MVVNAKSCRLRCCQVYGEPFFCTSHVLVQQTLHSVFAIEGEDDFSQVRKDDFPLPKVLAGALKARKNDIPVKGREGIELSDGDGYGYVTPSDVPELLDNHIVKGEIIDRIWRF
ncbi:putative thioredoxin-like ferredoxin, Thioredoxin-like superfamily [Helianthus annuus]|uniref:Thioredoxin-like ferredoxin n=1 Tax=Helianthus annuus TaxID=4232 RepID=A0A9K3HMR0_HELAN|nr:putative thioredoxin-like ferredoxin [Helianthus annuus]KAJ0508343.1 putative thioredoxin-like ferredoxin, Thioredoxin-like superfamily [Helianthus annuus]KAJ0869743.1 putative thioredoxin-like ferredoxin, Thioredoxin-like superfamily [Helianthus annuus]KAJ0874246.1 putative thioredoxin-like ferredoxin [Helianthus annuus]